MSDTRRVHERFRTLVARAIVKADQAEAAHLAALRPHPAVERRRGRRRGGSITLTKARTP